MGKTSAVLRNLFNIGQVALVIFGLSASIAMAQTGKAGGIGPINGGGKGGGSNLPACTSLVTTNCLVNANGSGNVAIGNALLIGPFTIGGNLPAATTVPANYMTTVTNGSTTSDCTVGGGSKFVLCQSNGTIWASVGGGSLPATVVQTNQANTYTSGMKQTFQSSATTAGEAFGGVTADPSSLVSGDRWFRSDTKLMSYYDGSATQRIVANGQSNTYASGVVQTFPYNGIGVTPTDSLLLQNTTSATSTNFQYSPAISLTGQGYNNVNGSQALNFRQYLTTLQGFGSGNGVEGALNFDFNVGTGSYYNAFSFTPPENGGYVPTTLAINSPFANASTLSLNSSGGQTRMNMCSNNASSPSCESGLSYGLKLTNANGPIILSALTPGIQLSTPSTFVGPSAYSVFGGTPTFLVGNGTATTGVTKATIQDGAGQSTTPSFKILNNGATGYSMAVRGVIGDGLTMTDSSGACWQVTVAVTTGVLTSTSVTCR